MTAKSLFLIASALALSITGAFAADPAPALQKEQRICRGSAKQLGSHIRSSRRCRTEAQWREEDEAKAPPISLQMTEGQNDGHVTSNPRR
jgi:hypothetical protein